MYSMDPTKDLKGLKEILMPQRWHDQYKQQRHLILFIVQILLQWDNINGGKWCPLDRQLVPFITGKNASFSQIPNIPPLSWITQFHLAPQGGGGDGKGLGLVWRASLWPKPTKPNANTHAHTYTQVHTHTHKIAHTQTQCCQLTINNRKTSSA